MGEINWLAVVLGALAFFAVGMVWYTVLFGKAWQRATGLTDDQIKSGTSMPVIFALAFFAELVVATVLAHQFSFGSPSPRGMMMIAVGYALGLMIPALGINYLFLRKPLRLFAIDAGHLAVGMAAMGAVFVALA